jgi:hypothetical protein
LGLALTMDQMGRKQQAGRVLEVNFQVHRMLAATIPIAKSATIVAANQRRHP